MPRPPEFKEELISHYDRPGPRYTSYPPATEFHDRIGEREFREWARQSNEELIPKPLSLYFHIPFCSSICYYCACNKVVTRRKEKAEPYLRDLHREIEIQSELFDRDREVRQLHWGGGTPGFLSRAQSRQLMEKIRRHFRLHNDDSGEYSIEIDPRVVEEDGIGHLRRLGFNRISLGVQDFDSAVQKAVNRIQSLERTTTVMDDARDHGFRSINVDLIYGLPQQTVKSFDQTLDLVIQLDPDRIAIYNYAHLPQRFKGQRMINADDIPAPETKLEVLELTIERLTEAGYIYIGMDHFALPEDDLVTARRDGSLQRNFQGYSTHRECDLIGLGVSSISDIGNVYAQNAVTTLEYESLIENGSLPIRKGIAVDDDDRLRADVIQALMCYDALLFDDFDASHEVPFRDYFAAELERLGPLADDELIAVDDEGIHILPKGRLLLRNIAMTFDRYFSGLQEDGRFSRAI